MRGRWFVRYTGNQVGDLYVLPLAGNLSAKGEPRRLTSDNRIVSESPGPRTASRNCVFFQPGRRAQVLWRVAISGPGETKRLSVGENGFSPLISRQGNRLVYSQTGKEQHLAREPLRPA